MTVLRVTGGHGNMSMSLGPSLVLLAVSLALSRNNAWDSSWDHFRKAPAAKWHRKMNEKCFGNNINE